MSKRRFQNKVVLITGASSGIGQATAIAFAVRARIHFVRREASVNPLCTNPKYLRVVDAGVEEVVRQEAEQPEAPTPPEHGRFIYIPIVN